MKKLLLSFSAVACAFAMYAAEPTVYFEDDFEYLAPWAAAGDNKGKAAGSTILNNDQNAYCPAIATSLVDDVTTFDCLKGKGYEFMGVHHSSVAARDPEKQIYLNANYLKFGLTDYFSGFTLPAMPALGDGVQDAVLTFDWCPMRSGKGVFDKTELVVLVKNGDDVKSFLVEPLSIDDNADFKWYPATVNLTGATLNKDTRITIRNVDSQYPPEASKKVLRWFIDNLKLMSSEGAGVADLAAENASYVEYYNLQGVRVAAPENGIYIVKEGNKVSKRFIK